MKELIEQIADLYTTFYKNANDQLENGNNAAGYRARKAAFEIEKTMIVFRKQSIESSK